MCVSVCVFSSADTAAVGALMQRAKNIQSSNPVRSHRQPNIYLKCIYLSFLPSCFGNPIASIAHTFHFFFSSLLPSICLLTIVVSPLSVAVCFMFRLPLFPRIFVKWIYFPHKHFGIDLAFYSNHCRSLYALYCLCFVKSVIYLHMTHE